jgi:2-methylisocitrate lyase-like PEP mutase family enzyme
MSRSVEEKRRAFRELHARGCFVLPNPWDVGSARMLAHLGFPALASTSSGFSWSRGRPDYGLRCADVVAHLRLLCDAVDVPVNADFESGFAREPEALGDNVRAAVATGIAGVSIEDREVDAPFGLYERALAVERVRGARRGIDQTGADVVLVARTEILLADGAAITPAIDKLVAFAEAGADCLYAPGVRDKEHIATMVRAVAPKPVNVLMMGPGLSVAELAELGVRRISVGGALARVAWAATIAVATQIRDGSFAGLAAGTPGAALNDIFKGFPSSGA